MSADSIGLASREFTKNGFRRERGRERPVDHVNRFGRHVLDLLPDPNDALAGFNAALNNDWRDPAWSQLRNAMREAYLRQSEPEDAPLVITEILSDGPEVAQVFEAPPQASLAEAEHGDDSVEAAQPDEASADIDDQATAVAEIDMGEADQSEIPTDEVLMESLLVTEVWRPGERYEGLMRRRSVRDRADYRKPPVVVDVSVAFENEDEEGAEDDGSELTAAAVEQHVQEPTVPWQPGAQYAKEIERKRAARGKPTVVTGLKREVSVSGQAVSRADSSVSPQLIEAARLPRPGVQLARAGIAMVFGNIVREAVDQDLSWQSLALCAQTDPEAFFPEKGGSTRQAKAICKGCEVRGECLAYAIATVERYGIWGGLSERERRKIKSRRAS